MPRSVHPPCTLPRDLAAMVLLAVRDTPADIALESLSKRLALLLCLRPVDLAVATWRDARLRDEDIEQPVAMPSHPGDPGAGDAMVRMGRQLVNMIARGALATATLYLSILGFIMVLVSVFLGSPELQLLSWLPILASGAISLRRKIISPAQSPSPEN